MTVPWHENDRVEMSRTKTEIHAVQICATGIDLRFVLDSCLSNSTTHPESRFVPWHGDSCQIESTSVRSSARQDLRKPGQARRLDSLFVAHTPALRWSAAAFRWD